MALRSIKVAVVILYLIHPIMTIGIMDTQKNATCPKIKECKCEYYDKGRSLLSFKCTGTTFKDVVAKLPNNTGLFIYSAQEMLLDLGSSDFSHLSSLQIFCINGVDIHKNRRLKPLSVNESKIFKPLKKLIKLSISIAWEQTETIPELFRPLTNLVKLDLSNTKRLNFKVVAGMLYGFQSNNKLSNLNFWNIQNMDAENSHLNFTELLFHVKHCPIKKINIGYNAIQTIYPGLTLYAKHLRSLLMANNFMNNLFRTNGFIDILVHPTLRDVSFDYQGYGFKRRQKQMYFGPQKDYNIISDEHMSVLDSQSITNKQIEQNIDNDWKFNNESSRNAAHYVGLDDIYECFKGVTNRLCDIFDPKCDDVRKLFEKSHNKTCAILHEYASEYFEGIPCDYIPQFKELFRETCAGCIVIPFTGSLKNMRLAHLNIYDEIYFDHLILNKTICFNSRNSVAVIDMSYNRDRGYPETAISLDMRVVGLETLEVFNAAQIGLTKLSTNTGRNFPNLKRLDVSDNSINLDNAKYQNIFSGLDKLVTLRLSSNDIRAIPRTIFANLTNIKNILLDDNLIEQFEVDLSGLSHLNLLDLSDNEITSLSEKVMKDLDFIASQSNSTQIKINLSKNDLLCSCHNIDFIEWAVSTKHPNLKFINQSDTLCININSHRVPLSMDTLNELKHECTGFWVTIAITVGITVPVSLLIFTLVVFTYRKRWWFRYQYFLTKQVWRSYKKYDAVATNYQYDVFVSYNQRDSDWVDDILQPMLEEEHGLKLCLHHRDFMFGEYIAEQIISSIENSRKTLLVLTPNFLSSTWCQFEMQMAQNKLFSSGKDVLLLALLKPLPKVGISKILKALLEQKTYIEWSDDEYGQKLFWVKLIQAINAPRNEPYDLDYPETQGINYGYADENTNLLA